MKYSYFFEKSLIVDLELFSEPELSIGQSHQSKRHLCQIISADKLKADDVIWHRPLI